MIDELRKYVITDPYPFVLDLAKCHGMWLVTVDGQELFDWTGYYGSKLVGHNHPRLSEPEYQQRLLVAANNKVANPDYLTQECLDYYRKVYAMAPDVMKSDELEIYAVNSGAEAVENMMKYLIAKFNSKKLAFGKIVGARRFLYFDRAFHGRTIFALGVTQTVDPVATKDFQGLSAGGNIKLAFPAYEDEADPSANQKAVRKSLEQVESVLQHMAEEIVGILVEPIQGAGGHRVALPEFFRGLSTLAEKYGVYLAFDEVQTGLGATGKMWAIDHFDLPHPPMAIATGKKFGCGVVYMKEPLEDIGILDSTWGGTLADMVRVVQEIKIVEEENLVEQAAANGEILAEGLRQIVREHNHLATNVRGMGIYQGFSLKTPQLKAALIKIAREKHQTLLLGAGNRSIRTRPSLSVTKDEIHRFLEILDRSLCDVASL